MLDLLDFSVHTFRMVDTNWTHETASGADRTQEVSGSSPLSSIRFERAPLSTTTAGSYEPRRFASG
jgi:hypothetical protein